MIPIDHETYLCDTPGFSSLYTTDMEKEELKNFSRNFIRTKENAVSSAASTEKSRAVPSKRHWNREISAKKDLKTIPCSMKN